MESRPPEDPAAIPTLIALVESYAREIKGLGYENMGQRLLELAEGFRRSTRKLHFVDEVRATEISNRSRTWLRARFDEWAVAGGALFWEGHYFYRECVLPRRIPDPRNAGTHARRSP